MQNFIKEGRNGQKLQFDQYVNTTFTYRYAVNKLCW